MSEKKEFALLIEDLERWSETFEYKFPDSASIAEKVEIRRQYASTLAQDLEAGCIKLHALAEFTEVLADIVYRVNTKAEKRMCEIQEMLGHVRKLLDDAQYQEAKNAANDVVGELQFQDIQRQELETVEHALRGFGDFLGQCDLDRVSDILNLLPEVLSTLMPRTDIDAADVYPSEAGPAIELF